MYVYYIHIKFEQISINYRYNLLVQILLCYCFHNGRLKTYK